jgi:hypothetical protein
MMTNGRSAHQIKTTDPRRRALWLRLFGMDVLPVKWPFPEPFVDAAGNERMAYVLDSRHLTPQQTHNLASYLQARTWGMSYQDACRRVGELWTIDAENVEVVETAVSDERPFFIARRADHESGLFVCV